MMHEAFPEVFGKNRILILSCRNGSSRLRLQDSFTSKSPQPLLKNFSGKHAEITHLTVDGCAFFNFKPLQMQNRKQQLHAINI